MKKLETELEKLFKRFNEQEARMKNASFLEKMKGPEQTVAIIKEFYQTAYTEGFEDGYQKRSEDLVKSN